MQLDAYVQDKFYKTITVPNTNSALTLIVQDIENGLVPHFDNKKAANIRLTAPANVETPQQ